MAEAQAPLPAEAVPGVAHSPDVDKDALIARLDALLEQYLYTLDEYEKLMQKLSRQLSSGFFSLAQANFHNRSGMHYGQDSYDERVQATRKIVVTEDEVCQLRFSATSTAPPSTSSKPENDSQAGEKEQNKKTEECRAAPEEAECPPDKPAEDTNTDAKESKDTARAVVVDPIRMFGILVPPALRSAQASFREAIDGPVVGLATVTGELRALEREIGRTRKSIRKAQQ